MKDPRDVDMNVGVLAVADHHHHATAYRHLSVKGGHHRVHVLEVPQYHLGDARVPETGSCVHELVHGFGEEFRRNEPRLVEGYLNVRAQGRTAQGSIRHHPVQVP